MTPSGTLPALQFYVCGVVVVAAAAAVAVSSSDAASGLLLTCAAAAVFAGIPLLPDCSFTLPAKGYTRAPPVFVAAAAAGLCQCGRKGPPSAGLLFPLCAVVVTAAPAASTARLQLLLPPPLLLLLLLLTWGC